MNFKFFIRLPKIKLLAHIFLSVLNFHEIYPYPFIVLNLGVIDINVIKIVGGWLFCGYEVSLTRRMKEGFLLSFKTRKTKWPLTPIVSDRKNTSESSGLIPEGKETLRVSWSVLTLWYAIFLSRVQDGRHISGRSE